MASSWSEQLDRFVDMLFPEMVAIRRHLHAHPEVSGEESQTTAFLHERLNRAGFSIRYGADRRGLLVDSAAPAVARVALRAELDALRIQDHKRVEYRSQTRGVMHACGHDAHTAAVTGSAMALQAAQAKGVLPWPVAWRAIFQPAEETNQGARAMIADGALDDVEAILGLHADPFIALGTIGVRVGCLTAACDEITITIEGQGAHAARPHQAVDPIAAAAQLICTIYQSLPRVTDACNPVVVTFGQVSAGQSANVIPQTALLRGTMRVLDDAVGRHTRDHIRRVSEAVALSTGAQVAVDFDPGPPAVINDAEVTALVRRVGEELLGPESVRAIARPSMGGDDFAYYLQQVPGSLFRLGTASPAVGHSPLHSPTFDIDEAALAIGAKILARAVVLASAARSDMAGVGHG